MLPILTKMAVQRKMEFEHVILLGNYELCYALGVLAKVFNIPKSGNIENLGTLRKNILDNIADKTSDDIAITRLLHVTKEMDTYSDELDDQMYELYAMGYEDGGSIWIKNS